MSRRSWTKHEDATLRRLWRTVDRQTLLDCFESRTWSALRSRAKRLAICEDRTWTAAERQTLAVYYSSRGAEWVARKTGRSLRGVYQMAAKLRLQQPRDPKVKRRAIAGIRKLHRLGWSDNEIAERLKLSRGWVSELRRELGLVSNRRHPRQRRRVAEATAKQLAAAGKQSLAEVRAEVFEGYAVERGWPRGLRPRAVQILDALYERGPMTRLEICEAIGVPWRGSRKSLVSNDKGGSYLAHLMRVGLVHVMRRARRRKGSGRSCDVYMIPIKIKRGEPDTWPSDLRS